MSQTDLTQFLSRIAKDSKLQDQLKGVTERTRFTQTLVRLGNEGGFHFTAADVDATITANMKNPMQELSDAELATVAGGRASDAWTTIVGPCK